MTARSETSPQRSDVHDPQAGPETARLVALLRSLPDPPTPDGLGERIMAEVRRREARPRLLRLISRAASQPGAPLALAAGLACLAVFVGVRGGPGAEEPAQPAPLVPSVARPIGVAEAVFDSNPGPVPLVPDPVALFPDGAPREAMPGIPPSTGWRNDLVSRRLDHQLNRLMLDPTSFYRQIERSPRGDVMMARLAQRAAERGDAVGVAMHLRQRAPREPVTDRFIEQLFSAVLDDAVPRH